MKVVQTAVLIQKMWFCKSTAGLSVLVQVCKRFAVFDSFFALYIMINSPEKLF